MTWATSGGLTRALSCYLVTDGRIESEERLVEICRAAIGGGVTAVQLRLKGWSDRKVFEAARAMREICSDTGTLYLVNDRVDIALATGADGVHLGVDDFPVAAARRILGAQSVVGYSPEQEDDRSAALRDAADYLGVGPLFATGTKADAGAPLGIERFTKIVNEVNVPVVAIGGITARNARDAYQAGAAGVAVVSSVFFAEDPAAAAHAIVAAQR